MAYKLTLDREPSDQELEALTGAAIEKARQKK